MSFFIWSGNHRYLDHFGYAFHWCMPLQRFTVKKRFIQAIQSHIKFFPAKIILVPVMISVNCIQTDYSDNLKKVWLGFKNEDVLIDVRTRISRNDISNVFLYTADGSKLQKGYWLWELLTYLIKFKFNNKILRLRLKLNCL